MFEFAQTRFEHCRLVGVNLSMLESLEVWNPFDLLLERDSSRTARPDLSFASEVPDVPVIGCVLVHPQQEYGDRGRHASANEAIRQLLAERECSVVPIDTRLDENSTGLRTPGEVASLIARMDAVVTTRLHGTVLALKSGVPVVAVDPIAGGAKITRQAAVLDWPAALRADRLTPQTTQSRVNALVVPIAPEVAGTISTVAVRNNQRVSAGAPLFSIDTERFELAVQTARANLESAERAVGA